MERNRNSLIPVARAQHALALFVADQHRWSVRPCATCKLITGLLGEPFGCDAFRLLPKEQQNRAHGGN